MHAKRPWTKPLSALCVTATTLLSPAFWTSSQAQGLSHAWSQGFGDWGADQCSSVSIDRAGNVVATGFFEGSVDFGGGALVGAGDRDIFVAKFGPSGGHVWSHGFGDEFRDEGLSIVVDVFSNVIVTGRFQGTVDFGGGPLNSTGDADIFLAKFDASGNHLWSQRFGGGSSYTAVAADRFGSIVVTGEFQQTVNFGGGPLTSAGESDIFLAEFDASGNHLWSQRFGDSQADRAQGLAIEESGSIVLTGWFRQTVDFGGGPLTSAGDTDIFLAKFDPSGNHLWSRRFGDLAPQFATSVTQDQWSNLVLAGSFNRTVDFGGGPLTSAGAEDVFLAKFDASGNHLWSQRFGDVSGFQVAGAVGVDCSGCISITGYFTGTVDFGGGPLVGYVDVFLAKFDTSGGHLWSQRFGDNSYQLGYGIAVECAGNVVLTGGFSGRVDFGGGLLTSAGGQDIFVAKFGPGPASTADLRVTKTGPASAVLMGEDLSYGITVTNNGPGSAPNVIVEDVLPRGTVFVSAAPSQGTCSEAAGVVTCELGELENARTATIEIAVNVTRAFVVNEASVSSDNYDPTPANNSSTAETEVNCTAMGVEGGAQGGKQSSLGQNEPNPFNPVTGIRFATGVNGNVVLCVYDTTGRVVRTLVDEKLDAGAHRVDWDGRDDRGKQLASGIYFYDLRIDGEVVGVQKAVILK